MRTFHVGGTASTSAKENRLSYHYPTLIGAISGSRVEREDDKVSVFTRKGMIEYFRVNAVIEAKSYDTLLVEDGQVAAKGAPLYIKGKKEIASSENGVVRIIDGRVYLVGHGATQVVKTGSELHVATGDYVEAKQPIVTFDPFSEPIVAEEDGFVSFVDIKLGTTLIEEVNEETCNIEKKIT